MPENSPLTAAGSRQPEKVPPIPPKVREAVRLMVFGKPDDENCAPLDFIAAGRIAGVKPDVMRRWLDRPNVRALLLAERRAFRNAINAGNELALKNIRDTAANSMARIGAIRALEELGDDDAERQNRPSDQAPGITIRVVHENVPQPAPPVIVDVTPDPASFDAPIRPPIPAPLIAPPAWPARDTTPPPEPAPSTVDPSDPLSLRPKRSW